MIDDQQAKMIKRLTKAIQESQSFAHVLIESGVVPGISNNCRCEDCKYTAAKMAEAGYLESVSDRWWEADE